VARFESGMRRGTYPSPCWDGRTAYWTPERELSLSNVTSHLFGKASKMRCWTLVEVETLVVGSNQIFHNHIPSVT
jgi:hypothetical protein